MTPRVRLRTTARLGSRGQGVVLVGTIALLTGLGVGLDADRQLVLAVASAALLWLVMLTRQGPD